MSLSAGQLISKFETIQAKRYNWDSMWQDVKDLVWPHGGDFTVQRTPGDRVTSRQYDMTNALALEKFGAVLESLLTPRQQRFHMLKPSVNELAQDRDVAIYFEKVTNLLFQLRNRPIAGFYDQYHECWKSHGAYGNNCISIEPLPKQKGISYRSVHVGNVWIEVNDRGIVDTVFYKFRITAHAAFLKWGPKRAPKCVQDAMKQGKEWDEFDFLHILKPRMKVMRDRIGPERMPIESWEISLKDREFIPWSPFDGGPMSESGGYFTYPYIFARFSTNPSENLGRGPAMIVLADNAQLQEMERSATIAGQIAAEPPLMTMDDSVFGEGSSQLDLRPSALNSGWLDSNGNPRAKPLISGYQYQLQKEMSDQKRSIINDAHFITLFQILVQTPEMTATEALLRAQEKGMLIAPMVGRQQSESLGRTIEREIDLADWLGLMPEPPPILIEAKGEYEIEYSSMATRIQREEEVQGILATYADLQVLAAADQSVVEVLDTVGAARFIAKARGVPDHLINDEERYMKRLQAANEAAAQREAVGAIPQMAKAAKDMKSAGIDPNELARRAAAA